MAGYSELISRAAGTDSLVPEPFTASVIKEMVGSSTLLTMARRVPMSTKTNRQPVLTSLPTAYWVSGDTGLKQTDSAAWDNVTLNAEELAVIVPIPEAYLDDSAIDIQGELRPLLAEAFGRAIDLAGLFNVSRPATWSEAIVNDAVNVYNIDRTVGAGDDLAQDVSLLYQDLAEIGVNPNGAVATPGFSWQLVGLRTTDGHPIYSPPQEGPTGTLFGRRFMESDNGGWLPSVATAIVGDWSKAIIGVRQDMTFRVFTEGVITDAAGDVILNLMQQDSIALRAVMRVAFATANPVNSTEETEASRYYFGVLEPASS